ncbi:TfoX/Sxy family protein [bacterium]|nr:TfoX/Sxy family protein [bacterium]
MAFDEILAERIRQQLTRRNDIIEKRMFGGIAFMLSGNMCCGVIRDELMLRVGENQSKLALSRPHARVMDFTGKPMKGMVYVEPSGIVSDADLRDWLEMAIGFASSLPPK